MELFLFYFIHWGIPVLVLAGLLWKRSRTRYGVLTHMVFNTFLLWFLFLWGQWPIASFWYLKYILLLIILFGIVRGFENWRRSSKIFPKSPWRIFRKTILLFAGIGFGVLTFHAYSGRTYPVEAIALDFPLKNGTYYISSGGSNKVLNNHFGKGSKSQQYALDINKLGGIGKIASGVGPASSENHYIFGAIVYAPCSGKIIELRSDVADNKGMTMNVSAEDGQGNYAVLDCDGIVVSLVHLKQNSLTVALGDFIRAGTSIAEVGNSGFSQEPHLHLQAARWDKDSTMVGVPMKFNDFVPYRNTLILR